MAWHRLRLDVEPLVAQPTSARTFSESRRIRLSEMDSEGRLRLDSIARYLQDVAVDDVDETGWGAPEHLWVLRSIRMDVLTPSLDDREVELTTWCSGSATVAAGRRMSLVGDQGGRVELDSVWIHLGPDARPARIEGFGVYAESAGDRTVVDADSSCLRHPPTPDVARGRHGPPTSTSSDTSTTRSTGKESRDVCATVASILGRHWSHGWTTGTRSISARWSSSRSFPRAVAAASRSSRATS